MGKPPRCDSRTACSRRDRDFLACRERGGFVLLGGFAGVAGFRICAGGAGKPASLHAPRFTKCRAKRSFFLRVSASLRENGLIGSRRAVDPRRVPESTPSMLPPSMTWSMRGSNPRPRPWSLVTGLSARPTGRVDLSARAATAPEVRAGLVRSALIGGPCPTSPKGEPRITRMRQRKIGLVGDRYGAKPFWFNALRRRAYRLTIHGGSFRR